MQRLMPGDSARSFIPIWLLACVLAVPLGGCTSFPGGARIYDYADSSVDMVPGLATRDGDVYVLYVHGMGATPRDFYLPLLRNGQRLLGESFTPPIQLPGSMCSEGECRTVYLPNPIAMRGEGLECDRSPKACHIESFGELRRFTLEHGDRKLYVYSFYWDEAADNLQSSYSYTDQNKVNRRPAWINRRLKDRIVNEGFSDAVLYTGRFGSVMRQGLEAAICLMLSDYLRRPTSNVCRLGDLAAYEAEVSSMNLEVVAKSLGSRYVFDTLLPIDQLDELMSLAQEGAGHSIALPEEAGDALATIAVKRAVVRALGNVFMLTNQLPLLGLAALEASDSDEESRRDRIYCEHVLQNPEPECRAPWRSMSSAGESPSEPPTRSFFAFVESVRPQQPLTLVAFHDPEDVLGYKAGVHLSQEAAATVNTIEIEHRNAHVVLFSWAWPPSAHAAEDERRSSASIIWCGGEVSEQGRIEARDCRPI